MRGWPRDSAASCRAGGGMCGQPCPTSPCPATPPRGSGTTCSSSATVTTSCALTLHSASTDHFAHQCRWLRHVASRGIRVLDITLGTAYHFELPDCVFNCATLEEITVSALAVVVAPKTICLPRMKKLHLRFMQLSDPSVADKLTSGCPALEELDLSRCSLGVFRVSSDTVKTLSVTACDYLEIHVSAPSIASLKLSVAGRVKLDAMPSLLHAWVNVCGDGLNPHAADRHDFLDALCNAQHLELLRFGSLLKDMMDKPATEGPTFSKMKSLYLGEWLVVDFYRPLAYFFNHAPNLAMLSLDQWKLYNNGKISGPAYFRWKSTEKLNLPSVLSSDLEILRLRISKDNDAGEFSTLRRMLKEKTKPKEMEVVWF
ncbi:F-box/FBD/LRR-repeat protein At1g78750-like [Lolium perenne]|uniref:F-box/FBD/LRR-repeat protein At1g78750-like n=1 Tax=Lolium perenne TaxID=4522 RepID=UPI0021F5C1EC|nr:F-box/FBD/LRR-repeat protein At1g78750-like isoform X4 [Lolium perenne]